MKTISLKKVSAVAVASLGFGLLSVVPANAAITAATLNAASTTLSTAVGSAVSTNITITTTGAGAATEAVTGTVAITSKPTDSSVALNDSATHAATKVTLATVASGVTDYTNAVGGTVGSTVKTTVSNTPAAVTGMALGTLSITPDKPGLYVLTITPTIANGTGTPTMTAVVVRIFAGNFIDTDTTTVTSKNLACVVGATITGTTCAGVANGRIGVLVTNLAVSKTYYVTTTGGTIAARTLKEASGTDIAITNTNASNLNDGITLTNASSGVLESDGVQVDVTRADAGSVTIKVEEFNASTGIRETVATGVVTFGSAAALDIATVTVYGVSNGTCAGSETASTITYASKTNSSGLGICVITKNGAGSAIASSVTIVGNGTGLVGGAAVAALTTADGSDHFAVTGNGLSGTGKFTVTATDANSKVATGSIEIKYFDSMASIAITQTKFGIKDGVANYDNTTIATFSAKDKNGFPVAFGTAGSGDLVVDSDIASTQTIAVAGDNDSSATETLAPSTVSALGVETAGTITVDVSSSAEKVTLKIHNSTNTIPSNTITFFSTTDAFASLVVAAVNGARGTSQDVTATGVAKITGKTGYIIADSATATFFATAGTLSSTSAVNFKNGKATVSYATPLLGGAVTITATPSETATVASASAAITIAEDNNQAALNTRIDSLNAKIVALTALIAKIMKSLKIK